MADHDHFLQDVFEIAAERVRRLPEAQRASLDFEALIQEAVADEIASRTKRMQGNAKTHHKNLVGMLQEFATENRPVRPRWASYDRRDT